MYIQSFEQFLNEEVTGLFEPGDVVTVTDKNHKWFNRPVKVMYLDKKTANAKENVYRVQLRWASSFEFFPESKLSK